MKTLPLLIVLSLGLAATSAFADRDQGFHRGRNQGERGNERSLRPPRFGWNRPNFGGNGCPDGSMQVVFAPDNLSFSILFDKFVAQVEDAQGQPGQVPGGRMGRDWGRGAGKRDAMSCDILLPMQIPEGMQMEITRVDYRGFAGLPQGARGALSSTLNFLDRRGGDRSRINLRYQFAGPLAENYEISSGSLAPNGQPPQTEVSPCGGNVQLRIRNQLQIMSPQRQQASLTLDSIDGSGNTVYYVNWRQCQEAPQPDPRFPPGRGEPGHGFPGRGGRFGR
jgi:hypothetical protein